MKHTSRRSRRTQPNERIETHEYFMGLALRLADKAYPWPNPKVGAVVVKNGHIVGTGYHTRPGTAHAEIKALRMAGTQAKGATLYVTLEPCAHTGLTPPCIETILRTKVARVIIAMQDPNPRVHGKSIRRLKASRCAVSVGTLGAEALRINETFVHFMKTGTPWITMKGAMSLDGKIATVTRDSRGLSSAAQQQLVHLLRSNHQAILVGINTVLRDNPRLTSRLPAGRHGIPGGRNPLRIILDSTLRIPLKSRVLADTAAVIVVTTNRAPLIKERQLERKGITVLRCGTRTVDIRRLVSLLGKQGIISVLVEGGGTIHAAFLEAQAVNKVIVTIAPKLIGGKDAPTLVEGRGLRKISQAIHLKNLSVGLIGDDVVVEGYIR